MNQLISIIIPVYNTEKYLEKCISSITTQTLQNFELILVNDGSTDNSRKICDEAAKVNHKVKVIHQENQGVSTARNTGIRAATGEWIIFVDSDDYIQNNWIQIVTELISKYDVDFMVFNADKNDLHPVDSNQEKMIEPFYLEDRNVMLDGLMGYNFALFANNTDVCAPWAKVYKKSRLLENEIFFGRNLQYGEDLLFNLKYYLTVDRFIYYPYSVYHYEIRKDSITGSYKPYLAENDTRFLREMKRILEECGLYERYCKQYNERVINSYLLNITDNFFYAKSEEKIRVRIGKAKALMAEEPYANVIRSYSFILNQRFNKSQRVYFFLIKLRLWILVYLIIKVRQK